jgi:hypothetical protein
LLSPAKKYKTYKNVKSIVPPGKRNADRPVHGKSLHQGDLDGRTDLSSLKITKQSLTSQKTVICYYKDWRIKVVEKQWLVFLDRQRQYVFWIKNRFSL